jgi:hypothetical protein
MAVCHLLGDTFGLLVIVAFDGNALCDTAGVIYEIGVIIRHGLGASRHAQPVAHVRAGFRLPSTV